jgi:hypothetical protein
VDELYVVARQVLLDALAALGVHRKALVLVGAQAIYLRVGDADLAVAPHTTDADLAIDPAVLAEIPPIEQALIAAAFQPKTRDSVETGIAALAPAAAPTAAPIPSTTQAHGMRVLSPRSVNRHRRTFATPV